eukprot:gene13307-13436_t
MEDAYCHGAVSISTAAGTSSEVCIAGVFDGHGGDSVAKFAAKTMPSRLCRQLQEQGLDSDAAASVLTAAFIGIDEELLHSSAAQLKGSTAVVSLVTSHNVHIASCGDSRAVICRSDGVRQPIQDHSPDREDEQARIKQAGGQVLYHNGCRVMGALAMSRALGDHALRPYGVIADPDVATYTRQPEDEFLLLASDGLWGAVTNEDACTIISKTVTELMVLGLTRQQVTAVLPRMLAKVAMGRGSNDNITVLMMDLRSSRGSATSTNAQCKAVPMKSKGTGVGCSRITSAAVACIKRIIQKAIMASRRQEPARVSAPPVASPFERQQQPTLAQVWTDWSSFSSGSTCTDNGSHSLTAQGSCKSRKRSLLNAAAQQHNGRLPSQDSISLHCSQSAPAQIQLLHDEPPFKKFAASAMSVQQLVALQASA